MTVYQFFTSTHAQNIMNIDIDCLSYGIQFDDKSNPFLSLGTNDLDKMLVILQKRIQLEKKRREPVPFNTSR